VSRDGVDMSGGRGRAGDSAALFAGQRPAPHWPC